MVVLRRERVKSSRVAKVWEVEAELKVRIKDRLPPLVKKLRDGNAMLKLIRRQRNWRQQSRIGSLI